jgi:hypothetical protein
VLQPFLLHEFYNPVLNRIQMSADEKKTYEILTLKPKRIQANPSVKANVTAEIEVKRVALNIIKT